MNPMSLRCKLIEVLEDQELAGDSPGLGGDAEYRKEVGAQVDGEG